jgi:hypothetical protein
MCFSSFFRTYRLLIFKKKNLYAINKLIIFYDYSFHPKKKKYKKERKIKKIVS